MIEDRRKVIGLADALAQGLDIGVIEFGHRAALLADQVVMARTVDPFEMANTATEIGFGDQSKIAKEFQRSVDGRTVDRGGERTYTGKDLVRGQVLTRTAKRAEDHQALRCHSLTRGPQPGCELFRTRGHIAALMGVRSLTNALVTMSI